MRIALAGIAGQSHPVVTRHGLQVGHAQAQGIVHLPHHLQCLLRHIDGGAGQQQGFGAGANKALHSGKNGTHDNAPVVVDQSPWTRAAQWQPRTALPCLKQRQAVAEDQAVFIQVAAGIATQAGVTPGNAQPLEWAALQGVVDAQVALPLFAITGGGIDVVAAEISDHGLETRHAKRDEVIAVLGQPGALAGTEELADLPVSDQVRGGSVTLVDERERAVAGDLLVARAEGMATQAVSEQGAPGVVVHLTDVGIPRSPEAAAFIALGTPGRIAVLAIGAAVEIAQVSLQRAGADGQGVDQAEEVLLVEIFETAVVVLGGQVLGDL
ncbi:hypothetical protein D3C75_773160 [compost metagenome]